MNLTKSDKTTLAGLYLSKYNTKALQELGFSGIGEASNVIGYSIGSQPRSVRNYRDEFDRFFPENLRKGWQRPLKPHSEKIFSEFRHLDFAAFTDLVKSFLIPHYEEEKEVASVIRTDSNETVAKRLVTGKAAEEYFRTKYLTISEFRDCTLVDTTSLACGFDYKLSNISDFYCVEVKGLNSNSGNILVTEKEYAVASELKSRYCLFIVKNFVDTPNHLCYFDPVNIGISFTKNIHQVVQTSYSVTL
jgi:hypothetical protein